MTHLPYNKPPNINDYGATCIKIIAKHFGKIFNIQTLGVNQLFQKKAPLPCFITWISKQYVVLYEIKKGERLIRISF